MKSLDNKRLSSFWNSVCRFCNQELRSFWVLHQPLPHTPITNHAGFSVRKRVEVLVLVAVGEAAGFLRAPLSPASGWAEPRVGDCKHLQRLAGDLYPTVKPEQESPINLFIWFFYFYLFIFCLTESKVRLPCANMWTLKEAKACCGAEWLPVCTKMLTPSFQ